jgi:hypothetical protein
VRWLKNAFNKITFYKYTYRSKKPRNFKITQTADLRAMSEHVMRPLYCQGWQFYVTAVKYYRSLDLVVQSNVEFEHNQKLSPYTARKGMTIFSISMLLLTICNPAGKIKLIWYSYCTSQSYHYRQITSLSGGNMRQHIHLRTTYVII